MKVQLTLQYDEDDGITAPIETLRSSDMWAVLRNLTRSKDEKIRLAVTKELEDYNLSSLFTM